LAENGIRWIATDEEILARSPRIRSAGMIRARFAAPAHFIGPYKVREGNAELGILSRSWLERFTSAFTTSATPGPNAARTSFTTCRRSAEAVDGDSARPGVHHPRWGKLLDIIATAASRFCAHPYQLCTTTPGLNTVRLGDYLEASSRRFARLFAGSWIYHN